MKRVYVIKRAGRGYGYLSGYDYLDLCFRYTKNIIDANQYDSYEEAEKVLIKVKNEYFGGYFKIEEYLVF